MPLFLSRVSSMFSCLMNNPTSDIVVFHFIQAIYVEISSYFFSWEVLVILSFNTLQLFIILLR